ncbi:hypothetical protein [Fodinibius halophilus]|uniref:Uncharacterized protein n=1 Tax=Fodinibius halophilus TaxID=1736908 RepID=A0A6M1TP45_9BACT|nr:hypothetical protein [Fodinibius halophilus]NGP90100.1 hypothetical protein [Fodinibius halophilus]
MELARTLSRGEMKNVKAGRMSTNCVICWNEGANDAIIIDMSYNGNNPNNICRRNGPYSRGSWGEC